MRMKGKLVDSGLKIGIAVCGERDKYLAAHSMSWSFYGPRSSKVICTGFLTLESEILHRERTDRYFFEKFEVKNYERQVF